MVTTRQTTLPTRINVPQVAPRTAYSADIFSEHDEHAVICARCLYGLTAARERYLACAILESSSAAAACSDAALSTELKSLCKIADRGSSHSYGTFVPGKLQVNQTIHPLGINTTVRSWNWHFAVLVASGFFDFLLVV